MVYLITYDLNKPGQDYPTLFTAIRQMGAWWHYLDSTWLVDTALTAAQIRDKVRGATDASDNVLVVQMNNNWASFLPAKANEWINEHVK